MAKQNSLTTREGAKYRKLFQLHLIQFTRNRSKKRGKRRIHNKKSKNEKTNNNNEYAHRLTKMRMRRDHHTVLFQVRFDF